MPVHFAKSKYSFLSQLCDILGHGWVDFRREPSLTIPQWPKMSPKIFRVSVPFQHPNWRQWTFDVYHLRVNYFSFRARLTTTYGIPTGQFFLLLDVLFGVELSIIRPCNHGQKYMGAYKQRTHTQTHGRTHRHNVQQQQIPVSFSCITVDKSHSPLLWLFVFYILITLVLSHLNDPLPASPHSFCIAGCLLISLLHTLISQRSIGPKAYIVICTLCLI